MSSKPIALKEETLWADKYGSVRVYAATASKRETVSVCGAADYTDPAKLRELAAKINEAANALEESKRLTFADLSPGEWFRFTDDGSQIRVKMDSKDPMANRYLPTGSCNCCEDISHRRDEPVVRLKATFEVSDE